MYLCILWMPIQIHFIIDCCETWYQNFNQVPHAWLNKLFCYISKLSTWEAIEPRSVGDFAMFKCSWPDFAFLSVFSNERSHTVLLWPSNNMLSRTKVGPGAFSVIARCSTVCWGIGSTATEAWGCTRLLHSPSLVTVEYQWVMRYCIPVKVTLDISGNTIGVQWDSRKFPG